MGNIVINPNLNLLSHSRTEKQRLHSPVKTKKCPISMVKSITEITLIGII